MLGLDGDYISGKNTLPSTYNIGISFNYFADDCVASQQTENYKGEVTTVPVKDDFLTWTADPMIMPQVLAVPDEGLVITPVIPIPACTFTTPTLTTPIPGSDFPADGLPHTFSVATNFSGSGETFSLTTSALPAGVTASINPATGDITETNTGGITAFTATVTATNCAGSVTSNTFGVGV